MVLNELIWLSCVFSDIYWKNEHRLECSSEVCTATERDRYEKSVSLRSVSSHLILLDMFVRTYFFIAEDDKIIRGSSLLLKLVE